MPQSIEKTMKENLDFFIENQAELVRKYDGKVLVIKDLQVVGAFGNPLQAYLEACKQYELGTFSLQPCTAGVDAYSVTINSTVVFE